MSCLQRLPIGLPSNLAGNHRASWRTRRRGALLVSMFGLLLCQGHRHLLSGICYEGSQLGGQVQQSRVRLVKAEQRYGGHRLPRHLYGYAHLKRSVVVGPSLLLIVWPVPTSHTRTAHANGNVPAFLYTQTQSPEPPPCCWGWKQEKQFNSQGRGAVTPVNI